MLAIKKLNVLRINSKIFYLSLLTTMIFFVLSSTSSWAAEDVLRVLVYEGHAPKSLVEKFQKSIEKKYGRKIRVEILRKKTDNDYFDAIRNKEAHVVMLTHHYLRGDKRFKFIENGFSFSHHPRLQKDDQFVWRLPRFFHLILWQRRFPTH